ncbi:MAG: ATP synthase F0 subunit C [Firmicutes bacterium]|nr:ATP synthase F0 subunit C [Bacillota bacterium]
MAGMLAIGIGIVGLGLVGVGVAMGHATAKALDGIARQPEAADKINRVLILGLAIMESVAIYSLIIAILIIFILR